MELPDRHRADISIAKLRDYCLNTNHPRGRHKARLFASALGISATDADWLRQSMLENLAQTEANKLTSDSFGERWSTRISC